MKKLIYVIILLLVAEIVHAQPQYAYVPGSPAYHNIPFNSGTNKRQWLYTPSDMPGMPVGTITKLYLKSYLPATPSYAWLTIKIGNTTLGSLPGGSFATGLTTVYDGPYSGATDANNWLEITLQNTFAYDSLHNFIIECSQLGMSNGFQIMQDNVTGRSLYGYSSSSTGTAQPKVGQVGFQMLATGASPLTLKLKNINVKKENNVNTLSWTVAEEKDILNYQIESSLDAISFENAGTVSAYGQSQGEMEYQFNDYDREAVAANKVFYRLKVEEESGNYYYSPVVQLRSAESKDPFNIVASPVPFGDQLNISVSVKETADLSLTITDAMGRIILQRQERISQGANTISLSNMQGLSAGMYFVRADIPDNQQVLRIVKN